MASLPDEIWSRIMEMGVETTRLGFKDLCCLAITCRRFRRLSEHSALWSTLLALEFPTTKADASSSRHAALPPSKSLYKTKFERDKARKLAAWRLAVLKEESQIGVLTNKIRDYQALLAKEHEKMKGVASELMNLENVRRASVAINVWQPEVIRNSQRQLVEQCTVPVESRISALKMELRLCKQQIAVWNKACIDQKKKLDERKGALALLKYHPIHNYHSKAWDDVHNLKKRKLKQCSDSNGKVRAEK